MTRFILAAAFGILLATLSPERGAATTLPHVSAGTVSLTSACADFQPLHSTLETVQSW